MSEDKASTALTVHCLRGKREKGGSRVLRALLENCIAVISDEELSGVGSVMVTFDRTAWIVSL